MLRKSRRSGTYCHAVKGTICKGHGKMQVAVIYEESFTLYDQFHDRSIWDVVVQHPGEAEDNFSDRVKEEVNSLTSLHSYYDVEWLTYSSYPGEDA